MIQPRPLKQSELNKANDIALELDHLATNIEQHLAHPTTQEPDLTHSAYKARTAAVNLRSMDLTTTVISASLIVGPSMIAAKIAMKYLEEKAGVAVGSPVIQDAKDLATILGMDIDM